MTTPQRPYNPWKFGCAILLTIWLLTLLWWQNELGWSSLTIGSAGEWTASILTAGVLAFTVWEVFAERRWRREDDTERLKKAQVAEAQHFSIWTLVRQNTAGNRVAWVLAIQNKTPAPILHWRVHASAVSISSGEAHELSIESDES